MAFVLLQDGSFFFFRSQMYLKRRADVAGVSGADTLSLGEERSGT